MSHAKMMQSLVAGGRQSVDVGGVEPGTVPSVLVYKSNFLGLHLCEVAKAFSSIGRFSKAAAVTIDVWRSSGESHVERLEKQPRCPSFGESGRK